MAYFLVISQNLPGEIEEIYDIPVVITGFQFENETRDLLKMKQEC
jgi:hypothetical protein